MRTQTHLDLSKSLVRTRVASCKTDHEVVPRQSQGEDVSSRKHHLVDMHLALTCPLVTALKTPGDRRSIQIAKGFGKRYDAGKIVVFCSTTW